ncbi:MAG: WecB/TagA/CpsF family glycosyltransferase [Clostridium sp.]|nr:WecB/TagA/CpsF family glycosyltransferase [Clostridium sp.]
MKEYFNINYEFDREEVEAAIERRLDEPGGDYICVADGVVLDRANRDSRYLAAVNGGMFSVCDSSYVPLYIRWLYGVNYEQYAGSELFRRIVTVSPRRMIFMGTHQGILDGLKRRVAEWNPATASMRIVELPFLGVDEFDYRGIAEMIERDGAEIVWVALGAPKQELFMERLKPWLSSGVMIAVGAAFKFYSGVAARRAPDWMVRAHLEFVYRLAREPRKQFGRCAGIVGSLPRLLFSEYMRRRRSLL